MKRYGNVEAALERLREVYRQLAGEDGSRLRGEAPSPREAAPGAARRPALPKMERSPTGPWGEMEAEPAPAGWEAPALEEAAAQATAEVRWNGQSHPKWEGIRPAEPEARRGTAPVYSLGSLEALPEVGCEREAAASGGGLAREAAYPAAGGEAGAALHREEALLEALERRLAGQERLAPQPLE